MLRQGGYRLLSILVACAWAACTSSRATPPVGRQAQVAEPDSTPAADVSPAADAGNVQDVPSAADTIAADVAFADALAPDPGAQPDTSTLDVDASPDATADVPLATAPMMLPPNCTMTSVPAVFWTQNPWVLGSATPELVAPADLPAKTTTLVAGSHRMILAAKDLPTTGCLSADCMAQPCMPGEQPWWAALSAPVPARIAYSADGAVVIGVDGPGGARLEPSGKLGTIYTPGSLFESVEQHCPASSDNNNSGYLSTPVPSVHVLPDMNGALRLWMELYGEWGTYYGELCEAQTQRRMAGWLSVSSTTGATCVLAAKDETTPGCLNWQDRKLGVARTLPEGGTLHTTRRKMATDGSLLEELVLQTDSIWQVMAEEWTLPCDQCGWLAVDRLGDLWLTLRHDPYAYGPGATGMVPTDQIGVQTSVTHKVFPVPGLDDASHLVASGTGAVLVLGRPLAATPNGTTALELVQMSAIDGKQAWRTTMVQPMMVEPVALERTPGGGALVVAMRQATGQQPALWLAWLDAVGHLQRERLVPLTSPPKVPPLLATRTDGAVAVAIEAGGTWRIASLTADAAWSCKSATSACPPCDDGNPCTSESCEAGICVYAPAVSTACAGTCSGGFCESCPNCEASAAAYDNGLCALVSVSCQKGLFCATTGKCWYSGPSNCAP